MIHKVKLFLSLIILLLSNNVVFSREEIHNLQDSLRVLNSQVDNLKRQIEIQKENEVKIFALKESNESLNRIINLHGIWFTAIAIFITALGILIPILTYFFAILPTRKARKKLNERIKEYFMERKDIEVDHALKILSIGDGMERQLASKVLDNNYYYDYSDVQLFKVWTLLEEGKIYPQHIGLYTLTRKTNDYADKYFMRNNFIGRPPISDAIRYFLKGQMVNYWYCLDKLILDCGEMDREICFNDALSAFASYSKNEFVVLANRKELIDKLSESTLKNISTNWKQKIESWKVSGVNETYLAKKITPFEAAKD